MSYSFLRYQIRIYKPCIAIEKIYYAKKPLMQQVRHPGTAINAVPWSSMEEQLLCAVVHEFGPNFAFAADVLAACSQLQGIFRRASQCKEKFKQLTASGPQHCCSLQIVAACPGHCMSLL